MKLTLSLFIIFLSANGLCAQTESRNVTSNVHDVVVYMSGAELHHTATVRLTVGKQELVFTGLSAELLEQTLIVDIQKKDVTILSVNSRTNYMEPVKESERIAVYKDSLDAVMSQINQIDARTTTLNKEKDLLFKNEAIGGTVHGVVVTEIAKAADFYRQRMFDIDDQLATYRITRSKLYVTSKNLEYQINELNAEINPPTSEVRVVVMSPTASETNFSLKYQVPSAGWSPKYDVRSEGITQPVELTYRANIYNNCGLNWENVKIKLSTADPNQGAEKPELDKWDLADSDEEKEEYILQESGIFGQVELGNRSLHDKRDANYALSADIVEPSLETIEVAELSAEFEIEQVYTILSDAKPYTVEVAKHQLNVKYEHFAVPKMDTDAFLVAKVTGWNSLNLVSGEASVYYSGTYLGKSNINTTSVNDTLVLSMGRDKKVAIARQKITEASKKINSGSVVKENFIFETTIKNNRDIPIMIHIEDQLPISSEKEIQVTEEELSGGILDKYSGKITYDIQLQPGESKKIILAYQVKSPRGREIHGTRNVRRSRAKF
jgi:uncharacterized protein (TIGR02231 family)